MFIVASISFFFFYDIVLCFNDAHHDENNDGDNRKDKLDASQSHPPASREAGEFEKFWNPKEKFIKRMDIAIICGNAFACVACGSCVTGSKENWTSECAFNNFQSLLLLERADSEQIEEQIKMMERRVYDVMKVKVEFGYEKLTEELTKHVRSHH